MLIKYSYMIYSPTFIMGTMVTCTSSSWVMAWVGLEINMMGFIPIIIYKLTSISMENAIKYFLIQSMASMIIILSIMIFYSKLNFNNSLSINYLITLSLGLKAGVAPLHYWFPQIVTSLEWLQVTILLTWQKIAPLILLSFNFSFITTIFIISSAVMGAINGINQTMFKKLLAFSSIINAGWLLMVSLFNLTLWWMYFLLYSLITLSVITPSFLVSLNNLNHSNMHKINYFLYSIIFFNMLSLAGLPPLTGFFIKVMAIDMMTNSTFSMLIILSLLASSVISLYFYMRIMYNMLFQAKKKSMVLMFNSYFSYSTPLLLMMSLLLNFFLPVLIILS